MTVDKETRLARVCQEIRDKTGLPADQVAAAVAEGVPLHVFESMYAQVSRFETLYYEAKTIADKQASRADVADVRAQQYFVRLRDAGALKEGETY